jgi:hypothetical protein
MRRTLTVANLLVLLLPILAFAQAKPNFSGKWVPTNPSAMGEMGPTSLAVTQDDKTITIAATVRMGELKTVFNLDGSPAKSQIEIQGMKMDLVTKCVWDGNKLVMTTAQDAQGQSIETKQIWMLGTDGTLTVDITRPDFQGGGAPITTKLVYKKQ